MASVTLGAQGARPCAFTTSHEMARCSKRVCVRAPGTRFGSLIVAAQRPTLDTEVARLDAAVDDQLSRRPLELDAAGYFIIKIDRESNEIIADYYTNIINKDGMACDPDTGEVIPCTPGYVRPPSRVYRGRTAKEVSVAILETKTGAPAVTRLEHANYLGREFQRAEFALVTGADYIQD